MSNFRELLQKIGSGVHTGTDLTRAEAAAATEAILLQEATPAQIGAFMIAHRIKRPTAAELAGMLDAYDRLIPQLDTANLSLTEPVTVFGHPYDGRDRTAPVTPVTALILATAGVATVVHGGDRMATKYGIPQIQLWQELGVDFASLSLRAVGELLEKTGIGFFYLPRHFPAFRDLVSYRDQIGKRPPFASLELIWSPCRGNCRFISGFVHPPTEEHFRETFALRHVTDFTTVKGLEGSCDLSLSRTGIIGFGRSDLENGFERFLLHPRDWGFIGKDVPLESAELLGQQLRDICIGRTNELTPAAVYNGGFYLWRCGACSDLNEGFARAESMLKKGEVAARLDLVSSLCRELSG